MSHLLSQHRALVSALLFATALQSWSVTAAAPRRANASRQKCPGSFAAPMVRWDGRRPGVHVWVNGNGPYLFLIDTGAGGRAARADARLVETLRLEPVGTAEKNDGSVAGKAAAATMPEYILNRIRFGRMTRNAVRAPSRNYKAGIDGILGYHFFEGCLLTLDYAKGEVRVGPGNLRPGPHTIRYSSDEGGPQIPIQIGDLRATANLDTGDYEGFDLPGSISGKMRFKDTPRVVGTGTSANNTYDVREGKFAGQIIVGTIKWNDPMVSFADVFDNINVGSRALQRATITFDQERKLVRLTQQE